MGKPMGNGHPISAVVTHEDLVGRFSRRFNYFNTFAGNPVSCAAANAVLEVIEEERLQQNALQVGAYLGEQLAGLTRCHEFIGDIRGTGLFTGVELVTDRESRKPATDLAGKVYNGMKDRGVLIGITGPGNNVLKLRPPMVFSRADADFLIERLDQVLGEVSPAAG